MANARVAQAIKVNGMVYTSGSLPVVPESGMWYSVFDSIQPLI